MESAHVVVQQKCLSMSDPGKETKLHCAEKCGILIYHLIVSDLEGKAEISKICFSWQLFWTLRWFRINGNTQSPEWVSSVFLLMWGKLLGWCLYGLFPLAQSPNPYCVKSFYGRSALEVAEGLVRVCWLAYNSWSLSTRNIVIWGGKKIPLLLYVLW